MQYGEFIQKDIVALPVSLDHRPAIVGAPVYFADHPEPSSPHDLLAHQCINFRHGLEVYRWEFDKGDQSLVVAVNGPLITNDIGLQIRAALEGVGLALTSEEHVTPYLESGALVRVLEDWCPPFPGFFLNYPSRKQQPAALKVLIETLRLERDRWLIFCDDADSARPAISMIRIAGFSLDRLVRFHVLLGSDVEIVVKPHARAMGRARVLVLCDPVRNLYTYFGHPPRGVAGNCLSWCRLRGVRSRRGDKVVANSVPNTQPQLSKSLKINVLMLKSRFCRLPPIVSHAPEIHRQSCWVSALPSAV